MIPSAIRVFPLSKIKEAQAFGTREKAFNYFCHELKSRENPPGRFNIPYDSKFVKDSLILFQYTPRKNEEEIIAHAILISDGCIKSQDVEGYVGYYQLDVNSINSYNVPITKEEIYALWGKILWRSKWNLDISKYHDYMELLKRKDNLRSKCQ